MTRQPQAPTDELNTSAKKVSMSGGHVNKTADPLHGDRQQLIEEAAETMHDAYEEAAVREGWETQERSRKPWSEVPEANKRTMLVAVEAALAVFEKAQAPTDEEREDMIAWLMRDQGHDLSPLGRDYTDAEIADMLRRPAQTEPTVDEREALSNFLFSVYEHGSQPNALREADAILSFLASIRPAQTEPTDAQIEVIADSIESFFEEHVHMARRLCPDVWKRDLALVVLKAAFTAGQEGQS